MRILLSFLICPLLAGLVTSRPMTPEQEALANQARRDIAKTIEDNLVRIFAIATVQNEKAWPRQDDDGDDEIVTPNPNVLPQVAQILGAIFSGSLNITRVVDGTFGLVPNLVRNQLQGLVKLLTGENVNLTGVTSTTPAFPPKEALAILTSPRTPAQTEPETVATTVSAAAITENVAETTAKGRYKLRTRTKRTTTPGPARSPPVDDEIDRTERDLRAAARILEPYEHREPRFYAGMFSNVMENVNMTEVAKAVPTIFKGASQAFALLESMGMMETLPGSETKADVADKEQDEEEEEEE